MNELAVKQDQPTDREGDRDPNWIAISDSTKDLIKRGVSKNTLAAYHRALKKLDTWLSTVVNSRELNDAVLAEYLTHLHESGKSPATISQVVAAVKWQSTNVNRQIFGAIATRTLSGIRRDGRDRGRGQYRRCEKYAHNPLQ